MNTPSVTPGMGFINYAWPDLQLRVMAERYTGKGYAELTFYSGNNDGDSLLLLTGVNLLSTSTMSSLAKRLEKNRDDVPWTDILTFITAKTVQIARQGEKEVTIYPREGDTLNAEYLLDPILYLNQPTVLFGDYGSCKSLIALALGYIVQLPLVENRLGFTTRQESNLALFLDYEDDRENFNKRWSALSQGFRGQVEAPTPILYKRLVSPLYDNVEQVQRMVYDSKIKFIIIDSLGPATGGNLNEAEGAIRYYEALRSLKVTSLTLAHTAKDQFTKRRTIFGSVFFTNLARSVWECKAEQEVGEDEAIISLKHTKANLSRLHPPLGYRFTFTDNSISVVKADLRDTGLSGELPLPWQIKSLLRKGSFTVKDIAEQLGSGADTIGRTLRRMRTKNQVVKLEDDTWGLPL
jgi:hypothetical protein